MMLPDQVLLFCLDSYSHVSNYSNLCHFVENDDNDHTHNTVAIAILVVLLVVSLICCLGLIITVFKLYKKVIFLQDKIK